MSNNLLKQLELEFLAIEEQQHLQTLMIKQFQQELDSYEQPLDLSSKSNEDNHDSKNMSKVCQKEIFVFMKKNFLIFFS